MSRKPARRTPTKVAQPVIAGRVPESLHRQIKDAAKRSGRTMSDELAWRAGMSFEWEKTFVETRKALADVHRVIEGDLRQALRNAGYRPIHGHAGTYWMEPGMPDVPLNTVLVREVKTAIAGAVKDAFAGWMERVEPRTVETKIPITDVVNALLTWQTWLERTEPGTVVPPRTTIEAVKQALTEIKEEESR
jgi:hypothetical protein